MCQFKCSRCGDSETVEDKQTFSDGRIHHRLSCKYCGKFVKYVSRNQKDRDMLQAHPQLARMTKAQLIKRILKLEGKL